MKEKAMAKAPLYDAYLEELGVGIYKTRWFDPTRGTEGDWSTSTYTSGFAEAKMGLIMRRRNGTARFGKIVVTRLSKGNY
jgi:hypothetical protein